MTPRRRIWTAATIFLTRMNRAGFIDAMALEGGIHWKMSKVVCGIGRGHCKEDWDVSGVCRSRPQFDLVFWLVVVFLMDRTTFNLFRKIT